jgi:hypothetical protein
MKRIVALILVLVAIPSTAAASQPWEGAWHHVAKTGEAEKMRAEVDEVVSEMSFLIRGVARSRLRDECQPYNEIQIRLADEQVWIRTDLGVLTSPLDEPVMRDGHDGKKVRVHRWLRDGELHETLSTSRGSRTNHYRVRGEQLHVDSTIRSSRLPRPVKFTYTYQRR